MRVRLRYLTCKLHLRPHQKGALKKKVTAFDILRAIKVSTPRKGRVCRLRRWASSTGHKDMGRRALTRATSWPSDLPHRNHARRLVPLSEFTHCSVLSLWAWERRGSLMHLSRLNGVCDFFPTNLFILPHRFVFIHTNQVGISTKQFWEFRGRSSPSLYASSIL